MNEFTPMIQQYLSIKEQYNDCILFFRLGDFYEMFFDDAVTASRELEITLTGRDCGLEERAPMCGIPFHASEPYISKLISKGYKVAICEQVEDPALAKGIVKREVIRVVTPGTVTETSMLDEKKNNYLLAIYNDKSFFGLAFSDLTTGEFHTTQIIWGNTIKKLVDEIGKYSPSEITVNENLFNNISIINTIKSKFNVYISAFDEMYFKYSNAVLMVESCFEDTNLVKSGKDLAISASGALLTYIKQTQKTDSLHIQNAHIYDIEEYMVLDISYRKNLELTETMKDMKKKGSLLWVLDRTVTAMGGRTIRKWIEQPLVKIEDIQERLDALSEMKDKYISRTGLKELLKKVYDIERLCGKIIFGNVNCRDLVSLKNSIAQIPHIKEMLNECQSVFIEKNNDRMDILTDIHDLIDKAIVEDPPFSVKEGGIIKEGYDIEIDRLRRISKNGKEWITSLESSEREKTGIKNLRVGYNKVFGYYIEVTKSHYSLVPDNYIRKQTLVNTERYVTPELKDIENNILEAEGKLTDLEYEVFNNVKNKITDQINRIKNTAFSIGEIDAICSLAETAESEFYCKPEVNMDGSIIIKDGRHPVVEKCIENGAFVPNDVCLDMEDNRVLIITGPNMAGKSTYMRQVALIVLMAQIGSFVPASYAKIGIADKIFTRVGATDNLASGQSTFMVEMMEVANILNNATQRSLLILDEVGRGTSTFDGLSIAWAVIEYISNKNKIGSRTLFSTHYHELTELEGQIPCVNNYRITVEEKGDDIVFLRKIVRGGANDSYGIQVAKLAGLPDEVIKRAKEILNELEEADISKKESRVRKNKRPLEGQIDILSFDSFNRKYTELIKVIKSIDITTITPLESLNILYELQQKFLK